MALQSNLFRGDAKLEAAAVSDPAHILLGASGDHVRKIQQALIELDSANIGSDGKYGPATAAAVAAFKQKRQILNTQGQIDNIVGKKTMAALDAEMVVKERKPPVPSLRRQPLAFVGPSGPGGPLGITGPLGSDFDVILHTIVFFSGDADDKGNGGNPLDPSDRSEQEFLPAMDRLQVARPATKIVHAFAGSGTRSHGVSAANLLIQGVPDAIRGKTILYGFSAGAVNAVDVCRALETEKPDLKVDLLITVDLCNGTRKVRVDVPNNVLLNRNYFQNAKGLIEENLGVGLRGRPTAGRGVQNVPCDDRKFSVLATRHGQMPGLTSADAQADVGRVLR